MAVNIAEMPAAFTKVYAATQTNENDPLSINARLHTAATHLIT
jgi:hypothetical protein